MFLDHLLHFGALPCKCTPQPCTANLRLWFSIFWVPLVNLHRVSANKVGSSTVFSTEFDFLNFPTPLEHIDGGTPVSIFRFALSYRFTAVLFLLNFCPKGNLGRRFRKCGHCWSTYPFLLSFLTIMCILVYCLYRAHFRSGQKWYDQCENWYPGVV
jgi:hypothetical protein